MLTEIGTIEQTEVDGGDPYVPEKAILPLFGGILGFPIGPVCDKYSVTGTDGVKYEGWCYGGQLLKLTANGKNVPV